MKKLITICIFLILLIGFNTNTFAQQIRNFAPQDEETVNNELFRIKKELNFEDALFGRIEPIIKQGLLDFRNFWRQNNHLYGENSRGFNLREKNIELRERINNQILDGIQVYLTPEQIEKYKTIRIPLLQNGK